MFSHYSKLLTHSVTFKAEFPLSCHNNPVLSIGIIYTGRIRTRYNRANLVQTIGGNLITLRTFIKLPIQEDDLE